MCTVDCLYQRVFYILKYCIAIIIFIGTDPVNLCADTITNFGIADSDDAGIAECDAYFSAFACSKGAPYCRSTTVNTVEGGGCDAGDGNTYYFKYYVNRYKINRTPTFKNYQSAGILNQYLLFESIPSETENKK